MYVSNKTQNSNYFNYFENRDRIKNILNFMAIVYIWYDVHFPFPVFLVFCHGNVFRQMVLLAPEVGLKEGEFVFMMYTSTPGNPTIGDISWERGDALDKVRIYRGR